MNLELARTIDRLAAESLSQGSLPPDDALDGVRAVDVWERGPHAAMLFTVDEEADLSGTRHPVLYDVYLEQEQDRWRGFAGGMLATDGLAEELAGYSPGLHEISRTSKGQVRLIWAFATPEVAFLRLTADGQRRDRGPGRDGFVLLGATPDDRVTYARAVDAAGRQLPSEPILL
jgi:hypothetical protein